MIAVEVIGWAGTVSGTILGLPQVLRLVRTRRVDGLSVNECRRCSGIGVSPDGQHGRVGKMTSMRPSSLTSSSVTAASMSP